MKNYRVYILESIKDMRSQGIKTNFKSMLTMIYNEVSEVIEATNNYNKELKKESIKLLSKNNIEKYDQIQKEIKENAQGIKLLNEVIKELKHHYSII